MAGSSTAIALRRLCRGRIRGFDSAIVPRGGIASSRIPRNDGVAGLALVIALCLVAFSAPATAQEIITLENGPLRIEIDPAVFNIRFLGFPGGKNFVEPHFVEDRDRKGTGWLDPGGVTTDLIPLEEEDAALRRGQAEVIESSDRHVVLLGAESPDLGIRIKKEIRLDDASPKAYFIVTALSNRAAGPALAVRNNARIPVRSTVRVPKRAGKFSWLQDEAKAPWAIVNSKDYYLVPVPPTSPVKGLVLGGFAAEAQVENASGTWSRRLTLPPTDPARVWNGVTAMCVLDDGSHSYGLSLQGAQAPLTAATPLQLTEEWTFERRGG